LLHFLSRMGDFLLERVLQDREDQKLDNCDENEPVDEQDQSHGDLHDDGVEVLSGVKVRG